MSPRRGNLLAGLIVAIFCATIVVSLQPAGLEADQPASGRASSAKVASGNETPDVTAAIARIDEQISAVWTARHITPSPAADDAQFLRRVTLDLIGRIPSLSEARSFLDDSSVDKRSRLIEQLLASSEYAAHWSHVWGRLLMPEAGTNPQARSLAPGFETWLGEKLAKNAGYDQIVRELLTTPIGRNSAADAEPGSPLAGNVAAYYQAKDASPENLASGTARVFLGIRLECAQCHDHPFASWKREQFWGYAAFFASIQKQTQGDVIVPAGEVADRWELAIPGTERIAPASYPDGTFPVRKYRVRGRQTLADWMTSAKNPYFARATVNRLWCYFFGRGLIDPVDDMVAGDSRSSHPELLDTLARDFAQRHFDLKFLIRAIVSSRAYQLASLAGGAGGDDPAMFARMPLRGLAAEELLGSLRQAIAPTPGPASLAPAAAESPNPRPVFDEEFASRFSSLGDRPTDGASSILRALALMNGRMIAEQLTFDRSETLAGLLRAPPLAVEAQIETLYLAALSRKPTAAEIERGKTYVVKGTNDIGEQGRKDALVDLFWMLLNSSEFMFNH